MSFQCANSIFHCMVDNVLHLQFILMVCMSIRQVPELLGQTEAVLHMFRRYKIFCHFNAAVQIMDLMGCTCRNEHCIAKELHYCPALHTILII